MSNMLENIKLLRDRTGVGMMECKKVLSETNGDVEQAIELLRKAGQAKAVKKSSRVAAEGIIGLYSTDKQAAVIEVNSETDFVARDENFKEFVQQATNAVFSCKSNDLEVIKQSEVDGETLEIKREKLIAKIGENISIRRAQYFSEDTYNVASYLHNSKIGVVVIFSGGNQELGRDIAMQIAAENPLVIKSSELSQDLLDKEKEIFYEKAHKIGKPADKIDMIVSNQIKKFANDSSLLGQFFVKDPSITVEKLLQQNNMEIVKFIRVEVGEGIQKKEDNFVAEVMAQVK